MFLYIEYEEATRVYADFPRAFNKSEAVKAFRSTERTQQPHCLIVVFLFAFCYLLFLLPVCFSRIFSQEDAHFICCNFSP